MEFITKDWNEQTIARLLRNAFLILLIQNVLIFLWGFLSWAGFIGEIYFLIVLNLDLIGFLSLAIGYFFNAKLNSERRGLSLLSQIFFR